eukprot:gene11497-15401_t
MSEDAAPKPVKLPYFHRTLTPEDQALIGDITPKPITNGEVDNSASSINTQSAKISESSAWNSAKTWEERDCTAWAKSCLTDTIFKPDDKIDDNIAQVPTLSINSTQYDITIQTIKKVEGNASITHSRGKARYLYEFSFEFNLKIREKNDNNASDNNAKKKKSFKSTVTVADVINDQLDDIEIEMNWTEGSKPSSNADSIAIKNALIKEQIIKRFVQSKMKEFEEEFRKV